MNRKLLHFFIFLIIILGTFSIFYLCYNKNTAYINNDYLSNTFIEHNVNFSSKPINNLFTTRVAFISDTHENYDLFPSLKNSLSEVKPSLLIHTGDLTNFGTFNTLSIAQNQLNLLGFDYFALPGDHDIAETSSDYNFNKLFRYPLAFKHSDFNFLIIPNFYNFTPMNSELLNTILNEIPNSEIIVSPQPIYVDPNNLFADKFMGSQLAFENLSPSQIQNLKVYKSQRDMILEKIRTTKHNIVVVSGDHHRSSLFKDPINSLVTYHIVGSLSKYIYFGNSKILQSSLQSTRYSLLELGQKNENGFEFNIKEIEIK